MSHFPCPNPACAYRFDPAVIPAGVTLLGCPVCGTRFPYNAAVMASPPPAYDPYAATVAPGYAPPVPPPSYAPPPAYDPYAPPAYDPYAPPAYDPYAPPPQPPAYDPSGAAPTMGPVTYDPYGNAIPVAPAPPPPDAPGRKVVVVRDVPRGGGGVIVLVAFLMIVSVGLVSVRMMVQRNPFSSRGGDGPAANVVQSDLFNFNFSPPASPWSSNVLEARQGLQANALAYAHPDTGMTFALAARDYKDRAPRERDLTAGLKSRLGFFRNAASEPIADAKLLGKPATGYKFIGEVDAVPVTGECFAVGHQGVAYWWFQYGPSDGYEAAAKEVRKLRDGLVPQGARDKWEEKSNVVVFRAERGGYTVSDPEGTWKETKQKPDVIDPNGLVSIECVQKEAQGDRKPKADLLVLEIPAAGDPLKAAEEYLRKQLDEDSAVDEMKRTVQVEDGPLPADAGTPDAPVRRLTVTAEKDRDLALFYVISAVAGENGKAGVAIAKCKAKERGHWEAPMVVLAGSLKRE